jgi:hypothetical protein
MKMGLAANRKDSERKKANMLSYSRGSVSDLSFNSS